MGLPLIIGLISVVMITTMIIIYYVYADEEKPASDEILPPFVPSVGLPPVSMPPPSEKPAEGAPTTAPGTPTTIDQPVYDAPPLQPEPTAAPSASEPSAPEPSGTETKEAGDAVSLPPMKATNARLFVDPEFGGKYIDLGYGMHDLSSPYLKTISSVQLGKDANVALFAKPKCDPANWSVLVAQDITKLDSKYNNESQCAIVLPKGITNNMIVECNGVVYKIEHYRKRKFSKDVYVTYGSPKPTLTNCTAVNYIPSGADMTPNPTYRPPLPAEQIRLCSEPNYAGNYVDLPMGMSVIPASLRNNTVSIELGSKVMAMLFDKDSCSAGSWVTPITSSTAKLDDKYRNDAACVIVLPKGLLDNTIFMCNNTYYKMINGRKCMYSPAVHESWGKPPATFTIDCALLSKIPDGPPIAANPMYVRAGYVRLFADQDYKGTYADFAAGKHTLGAGLINDVSSVIVGPDVDAAIFDKDNCDTASWYLAVKDKIPSLGAIASKYNNDAACVIVLPPGVRNGDFVADSSYAYLIEAYHKRRFVKDVYESWAKVIGTPKQVSTANLAKIPDGPDMGMNPDYDPPLPAGKYARVYREANYRGGYVDLGYGLNSLTGLKTNLGDSIEGKVASLKVTSEANAIVYNKGNCTDKSKLFDVISSTTTSAGFDIQCVLVLPKYVIDDKVLRDGTGIYLIDGWRKRVMTPEVYETWKQKWPQITTVPTLAMVPTGDPVTVNRDYDPPFASNVFARVYHGANFTNGYADLTLGLHNLLNMKTNLGQDIGNEVSSVKVAPGYQAVIYDKSDCSPTNWFSRVTSMLQSLAGTGHDNDVACAIVRPASIETAKVIGDGSRVFKIENYHKRLYSKDAYVSWGSPKVDKLVSAADLDRTPTGAAMPINPDYVPPLAKNFARLTNPRAIDGVYAKPYIDLPRGMHNLSAKSPNLSEKVSAVELNDTDVALFGNADCSGWSVMVPNNLHDLSDIGRNDQAKCVIVLPKGIRNGQIIKSPTNIVYKIEEYRKRKFPSTDIYISWGTPLATSKSQGVIDVIPNGPDMVMNPLFVRPGTAKLYNGRDFGGDYVEVRPNAAPLNLFNVVSAAGSNLANKVSSIKAAGGVQLGVYDKDDCATDSWFKTISGNVTSFEPNDDAACVIVLPEGVKEGEVLKGPDGKVYKIVNHRRRWYPTTFIYTSWGKPASRSVTQTVIDHIPPGPNFAENPDYVPPNSIKLSDGRNYSGTYVNLGYGVHKLPTISPNLANAVTSVQVNGVDAVLWDKDDCSGWNLLVAADNPDLSVQGRNDDAACVFVLPKGIRNGQVRRSPTGIDYKIENWRKRKFPSPEVFQSWEVASVIDTPQVVLDRIPNGPDMTINPKWVPPNSVRLSNGRNYEGTYLNLGYGAHNLFTKTPDLANKVTSVQVNGVDAVLWDKDTCTGWDMLVTADNPDLSVQGRNDDAACVFVLPRGIRNGQVRRSPTGIDYKIEAWRKRKFPSAEVFQSWGSPSVINTSQDVLDKIPNGPDMTKK